MGGEGKIKGSDNDMKNNKNNSNDNSNNSSKQNGVPKAFPTGKKVA